MKKILYIFAVIFSLSVVSCQKQDIKPIDNNAVEVPTWESIDKSGDIEGGGVDLEITDPNNDPDGDKGKGKT